ncbi:MAG TPA: ATP-binding protein [Azospirillum sp.]|nr:ATP-binding protein [Azospirillum sp.]
MSEPAHLLVSLTVNTERRMIPAVCALVRETARAAGFDERQAQRLELAAEEAAIVVIEQSFEGRADGTYDLTMSDEGARFVMAVHDLGLPFDWSRAQAEESTSLSIQLLRSLTDEIRFVNLGKQGKRIEFVVNRSEMDLEGPGLHQIAVPAGEVPAAPADTPLEIRPLRPEEDGVALARCMYTVYGYSYHEVVYFPERLRDLIEKGLLVSMVAVTPDGTVAGHQGLKKAAPDARVANVSMGAVDPRFRGRKLFERLKAETFGRVKAQGLLGLYGEAVTIHPYSQKANFASGGHETGILLAYIPGDRSFKKIEGKKNDGQGGASDRQTAVLFYIVLNPAPVRTVYPPAAHRGMIGRIYAWAGVERVFAEPGAVALPERSEVDVEVRASYNWAVLSVVRAGRDLVDLVRVRMRELCQSHLDCVYLDLPLCDPATAVLAPELEALGFSFCGIYPEMVEGGDLLRLQYLNNVAIDPATIIVVTDFGRDLLEYVVERAGVAAVAAV